MEISLQYTPTKEDYIQSSRNFNTRIENIVVIILFLFGLEIYCVHSAFTTSRLETRADWFTPFVFTALPPFIAVVGCLLALALYARMIGKQVEKNAQLTIPTFWQMDDTQITNGDEFGESKAAWSIFQQAIEYDRFYLLVYAVNKQDFSLIPKRAFESPEHEAAFRALIEQKLGKVQNQIKQKKVILPLIYTSTLLLFATTIISWILLLPLIMKYR